MIIFNWHKKLVLYTKEVDVVDVQAAISKVSSSPVRTDGHLEVQGKRPGQQSVPQWQFETPKLKKCILIQ